MLKRLLRSKKGAAMVEYGLLIAGVALVAAAAVSIFGAKTNEMIAGVASVLPGAHADDNGPIGAGQLIETKVYGIKGIGLDIDRIGENPGGEARLGENLGIPIETLIIEPPSQ